VKKRSATEKFGTHYAKERVIPRPLRTAARPNYSELQNRLRDSGLGAKRAKTRRTRNHNKPSHLNQTSQDDSAWYTLGKKGEFFKNMSRERRQVRGVVMERSERARVNRQFARRRRGSRKREAAV